MSVCDPGTPASFVTSTIQSVLSLVFGEMVFADQNCGAIIEDIKSCHILASGFLLSSELSSEL